MIRRCQYRTELVLKYDLTCKLGLAFAYEGYAAKYWNVWVRANVVGLFVQVLPNMFQKHITIEKVIHEVFCGLELRRRADNQLSSILFKKDMIHVNLFSKDKCGAVRVLYRCYIKKNGRQIFSFYDIMINAVTKFCT